MRPWVEALEIVLATGERARLERGAPPSEPALVSIQERIDTVLLPERERILAAWPRVRKNSSGYALKEYLESGDLLDLIIGSEGTLALVTAAEVRLAPVVPRRGVALLEFGTLEAAGAAVETVLTLGPATCEILDRTFIELVRSAGVDPGYPLREGLEAILLVEMVGETEAVVAEALERVRAGVAGIASHVSLATEPERQASFWHVRKAASPLIAQRTDGRVSMQFIEDGVVPVARLADYIRALRRVLGEHGVPAVIFGHAGDGNLHVNPLVPVYEPDWQRTIESILWEITREVRALGGTMSGEHGDGRLRAPLLDTIWGAEMVARFRAGKDAFDPEGHRNPGVILPLPGQQPLEALRDYATSPPPAGAAALD
jgi:FAD/FMN-containing dehydrogenase